MARLFGKKQEESETQQQPLARRQDVAGWDPIQIMRSLLSIDPFRPLDWYGAGLPATFVPNIEIRETNDSYVFKADLPGVREEDLEVSITGNRVVISGRREEDEEIDQGERYYARERSYGSFTRAFTLPEGADMDKTTAEFEDGVLTLRVAKRPEVQPRRIPLGGKTGPSLEEGKKVKAA